MPRVRCVQAQAANVGSNPTLRFVALRELHPVALHLEPEATVRGEARVVRALACFVGPGQRDHDHRR